MKSPSGEAHDSLVYLQNSKDDLKTGKKVKRVNELEKIITNEDDGEKAVKRIEGNILMLRSIIRMLETITDQSRLEEYRPAAGMLSACITAASAGSSTSILKLLCGFSLLLMPLEWECKILKIWFPAKESLFGHIMINRQLSLYTMTIYGCFYLLFLKMNY